MGGIIGTVVGLTCAVVAVAWTARRNKRAGSLKPITEALGLGSVRSAVGVERAAVGDAARLAFPLFIVFAVAYVFATVGGMQAGVLAGIAGAIYGSCAALAGRRLGR
jgi:hypothetical protein